MNHNTDTVLASGGSARLRPPVATGTSAPRRYHSNFQDPELLPAVWPQHWPGPSFSWVEAGLQKAMQVAGVIIGHIQLGFESYRAGVRRVCPHCFQGWGSPSQVTKVFRDQAISWPHYSPIHRLGTGQSKQIRGITF